MIGEEQNKLIRKRLEEDIVLYLRAKNSVWISFCLLNCQIDFDWML